MPVSLIKNTGGASEAEAKIQQLRSLLDTTKAEKLPHVSLESQDVAQLRLLLGPLIGIAAYHDSAQGGHSVGAIVASTKRDC